MGDEYDYAYMHVMRQPAKVNTYAAQPKEDRISENVVNTSNFSYRDLQLFVDSMEVITRLEKAKYERRQNLKIKKHQESFENSKKIITCLDSSLACTSCDADAKSLYVSESDYMYEETYKGKPYASQTNATYSNIAEKSLNSIVSDSGESGVFFNSTEESHFYENITDIDPIRPRSNVISNPKCKSLKSRLISLIMKKQYVVAEAPIAEILSSTTYGEEMEDSEIYDRVLNDIIRHQFAKKPKRGRRRQRKLRNQPQINPEQKFLEKAMSVLTL